MKREIKYRGKRNSNGEWVYGLPSYNSGGIPGRIEGWTESGDDSIGSFFDVEVIPETITEFTGFKDKNGKEIYEGDRCIMKEIKLSGTNEFHGDVEFYLSSWVLNFISPNGYKLRRRLSEFHEAEVIGNIYSNPELTK